jgi:hypothetical protein
MSRTVCGTCWAPYGGDGECECAALGLLPQPVAWRFRIHPDKLPGSRWRVTDEYEHVAAMAARGDWEVVPLIEMKEDSR